nr:hypothetical protein CFP56_21714 [Quercus suber]
MKGTVIIINDLKYPDAICTWRKNHDTRSASHDIHDEPNHTQPPSELRQHLLRPAVQLRRQRLILRRRAHPAQPPDRLVKRAVHDLARRRRRCPQLVPHALGQRDLRGPGRGLGEGTVERAQAGDEAGAHDARVHGDAHEAGHLARQLGGVQQVRQLALAVAPEGAQQPRALRRAQRREWDRRREQVAQRRAEDDARAGRPRERRQQRAHQHRVPQVVRRELRLEAVGREPRGRGHDPRVAEDHVDALGHRADPRRRGFGVGQVAQVAFDEGHGAVRVGEGRGVDRGLRRLLVAAREEDARGSMFDQVGDGLATEPCGTWSQDGQSVPWWLENAASRIWCGCGLRPLRTSSHDNDFAAQVTNVAIGLETASTCGGHACSRVYNCIVLETQSLTMDDTGKGGSLSSTTS